MVKEHNITIFISFSDVSVAKKFKKIIDGIEGDRPFFQCRTGIREKTVNIVLNANTITMLRASVNSYILWSNMITKIIKIK
ncbi:MAG: hypothetical protein M1411_02750 [Candidatus Thermoplasmatota archaeon]|jgi:hypothetical protein|nr:hypothetical protein [Candidatus Thermoplasmatota archaeon]